MNHKKVFVAALLESYNIKKGTSCTYLVYKKVSSHDGVFDKFLNSELAYTSHPYSEALAMRPAVLYIPYATSSHEKLETLYILHILKR